MRAKKSGGARRAKADGAEPSGARRAGEREIAEMLELTPEFVDALPAPVLQHAWETLRDLQLPGSALGPKSKELIGLALAAHIQCRDCIYFHAQAARFHGATDDELREAVSMGGFTRSMSDAITGAQTDYERFADEVDRALEHMRSADRRSVRPARARH